jgi:hypothetical protein
MHPNPTTTRKAICRTDANYPHLSGTFANDGQSDDGVGRRVFSKLRAILHPKYAVSS